MTLISNEQNNDPIFKVGFKFLILNSHTSHVKCMFIIPIQLKKITQLKALIASIN